MGPDLRNPIPVQVPQSRPPWRHKPFMKRSRVGVAFEVCQLEVQMTGCMRTIDHRKNAMLASYLAQRTNRENLPRNGVYVADQQRPSACGHGFLEAVHDAGVVGAGRWKCNQLQFHAVPQFPLAYDVERSGARGRPVRWIKARRMP